MAFKNELKIPDFRGRMVYSENVDGSDVDMAANVFVLGDIGYWYESNARDVKRSLMGTQNVTEINLYISSRGGDLQEAMNMFNLIKGHPAKVNAYLMGFVASCGSYLACAADHVIMSEQCVYMLHRPSGGVYGTPDEMRKAADNLEKFEEPAVIAYQRKSNQETEVVRELMREETFMRASDALEYGFVDEVVDSIPFMFEVPEGYDLKHDQYHDYSYMNGEAVTDKVMYSNSAIQMLAKGVYPHDKQKFSSKMGAEKKTWSQKLTSQLVKMGWIPAKSQESFESDLRDNEVMAGMFSENEDINMAVSSLFNAKMEELKQAAIAEAAQEVTFDQLLKAVEGASAEEKEQLGEALGYQTQGEGNSDDGGNEAVEELEAQMKALKAKQEKEMKALRDSMATMKAGGTHRPSNGDNGLGGKNGDKRGDMKVEGELFANVSDAELNMLMNGFNDGQVPRDIFKKSTGVYPEHARAAMKARKVSK